MCYLPQWYVWSELIVLLAAVLWLLWKEEHP